MHGYLKTPIRCKLCIDKNIIQDEIKFKYLSKELSGYGDIEDKVRSQATKATRTAACLKNKYMGMEAKSRIYRTAIRPIMTHN